MVTDAISALGLNEGQHKIGQLNVEIRDGKAYIAGTDTLCGSVATMIECVHILMKATGENLFCVVFKLIHAMLIGLPLWKSFLGYVWCS